MQETELVGQIATALLFSGADHPSAESHLHPLTLNRISNDLDRERQGRKWMKGARHSAKERAKIRGLSRDFRHQSILRRPEEGRTEIADLGIEPRLILRPIDVESTSWYVSIEIPDLSNLCVRFPETKHVLAQSRCRVAGHDRPIARGRFLYGAQRLVLSKWPSPTEVFLKFEEEHAALAFLLKTECMLRPGPPWLFRIASDGLAYECRGLSVRPGQRYIVLTTADVVASIPINVVQSIDVQCKGIHGILLNLPSVLDSQWEDVIKYLELRQSRLIEFWPAGLAPVHWDGEGHSEWLAGEQPTVGIQSDHPLGIIRVSLDRHNGRPLPPLELIKITPGEPLFVQLPVLPVGRYTMRVDAASGHANAENLGQLTIEMRVNRGGPSRLSGPLSVRMDPVAPTLEQLWEGDTEIEIMGPHGRKAKCKISLLNRGKTQPVVSITQSFDLPVSPVQWKSFFEKYFRSNKKVYKKYDSSYECRVDIIADELGTFNFVCERDFVPLRWILTERNKNPVIRLIDDSGCIEEPHVSHFSFENPLYEMSLGFASEYEVRSPGGLYFASQEKFSTGIIALPLLRSLSDLISSPIIKDQGGRSLPTVLDTLELCYKWADARSSGDVLSMENRRTSLREIIRYLVGLIGGESWARAESNFEKQASDDFSILGRVVTKQRDEIGLATSLAHEIADLTIDQRVHRLAGLATEHRLLSIRESDIAPLRDPTWVAEFALRLASSPKAAYEWAGGHLEIAIKYLMEAPVIARAARFMVIVVKAESKREHLTPDEVYSGWRWK